MSSADALHLIRLSESRTCVGKIEAGFSRRAFRNAGCQLCLCGRRCRQRLKNAAVELLK